MADETRTLVGTWIDYLKNNKGEASPTDDDYSGDFNRAVQTLLETVVADVGKHSQNPEKVAAIAAELRQRHPGVFQRLDKFRVHYKTRYRMWKGLADERRQHSRAITIDHIKLFVSRLVYAVMIASVVLGTGYVAKLFDIPLPMLRAVVP